MKMSNMLFKYPIALLFIILIIIGAVVYSRIIKESYTNNAFVVAQIRPVSSQVAGVVDKIYVSNNQYVKKGAKLFSIQKISYQFAVSQAQASLKGQQYAKKSLSEQRVKDNDLIKQRQIALKTAQFNSHNWNVLAKTGAVGKAKAANLTRIMASAQLAVQTANQDKQITLQNIQVSAQTIQRLESKVKQAQFNLTQTTVYALTNGSISNLNLAIGTYIKIGDPLFSFIDTNHWWVQANFKETRLSLVKQGQHAIIHLSMYPHHALHGIVSHIGWAVDRQKSAEGTFLPIVVKENQWFLLPQRFPVLISISDANIDKQPLHVGATASVKILT